MDMTNCNFRYKEISELVHLKWKDIKYGLEQSYIDRNFIMEFAVEMAVEQQNLSNDISPIIIELLIKEKYDIITEELNQLSDSEDRYTYNDAEEKWMYIFMAKLYKDKAKYIDPIQIAEDIYAEFDYNERLRPIVRYTSSDEPFLGPYERYQEWEKYLENESNRFNN